MKATPRGESLSCLPRPPHFPSTLNRYETEQTIEFWRKSALINLSQGDIDIRSHEK
jgi:hypothetical protein